MRILLVEDEIKTADALKIGLENSGYKVDVAYDGSTGLSLFKSYHYAIIISDVIMPKINGFDLCRQIRQVNTQIPILLLTALYSKEHIVTGLDTGADDYLTKPFDFSELLARIRVLLKRTASADTLTFADLEIHLKSKQVNRAGVSIELTAKEFKLLEYFMQRPNTVITRDELVRNVWNINFDTGTNIVEVYISYLRNKIDKTFTRKLIHNVHGLGYMLK